MPVKFINIFTAKYRRTPNCIPNYVYRRKDQKSRDQTKSSPERVKQDLGRSAAAKDRRTPNRIPKLWFQTKQVPVKRPRKMFLVFKLLDRMLLVVVELPQNSPAIRQCPWEASEVITRTGEMVR
jgi:hypothetical protein